MLFRTFSELGGLLYVWLYAIFVRVLQTIQALSLLQGRRQDERPSILFRIFSVYITLDGMFEVLITTAARDFIQLAFAREHFANPGLMINRQGPKAENSRSADGDVVWNVDRRSVWRAGVLDLGYPAEDIVYADGVKVWLALIPRPDERGVEVDLKDGELHVEPLSV